MTVLCQTATGSTSHLNSSDILLRRKAAFSSSKLLDHSLVASHGLSSCIKGVRGFLMRCFTLTLQELENGGGQQEAGREHGRGVCQAPMWATPPATVGSLLKGVITLEAIRAKGQTRYLTTKYQQTDGVTQRRE